MPNTPDDPLRGTGRTSILLLRAIADAMERPNETVCFEDHAPSSLAAMEAHRGCLRSICNALDLRIEVGGRRTVWLKSKSEYCIEAHQRLAALERSHNRKPKADYTWMTLMLTGSVIAGAVFGILAAHSFK